MGTLTADAAAARKLFQTKVRPPADKALQGDKPLAESTREIVFGVDALIERAQPAPLELQLTKIKAEITKVEASLAAIDAAIGKVQEFSKANKASLDELPEVEKLDDELAEQRRRAATRIPALKAAQDKVAKGLKALADSRTEMNVQWATIEREARQAHAEILAAVKTMQGHRDKARVAAKAHDAKALAAAKGEAELMINPQSAGSPKLKARLADFAARYEKKGPLDANAQAQLKKDKVELAGILERTALNAKLLESMRAEIGKL